MSKFVWMALALAMTVPAMAQETAGGLANPGAHLAADVSLVVPEPPSHSVAPSASSSPDSLAGRLADPMQPVASAAPARVSVMPRYFGSQVDLVDEEPGETSTMRRLSYEMVGAAGGFALSIATSAAIGKAVGGDSFISSGCGTDVLDICSPGSIAGVVMYTATSPFLMAGGVTLAGNLSGSGGNYGASLLGAVAGTSLGWFSFVKLGDNGRDGFAVAVQPLLTMAGAMAGYELSRLLRRRSRDRRARRAQREHTVLPTASASPEGFTVGITGVL